VSLGSDGVPLGTVGTWTGSVGTVTVGGCAGSGTVGTWTGTVGTLTEFVTSPVEGSSAPEAGAPQRPTTSVDAIATRRTIRIAISPLR
jgi:hypothetical protein